MSKHKIPLFVFLAFAFSLCCLVLILFPGIRAAILSTRIEYGPKSMPLLISQLDADELTRTVARNKVVSYGESAVNDLAAAMKDEDQPMTRRAACADCLGRIGVYSETAIAALESCSSVRKPELLRLKSLVALHQLEQSSPLVLPGLVSLLGAEDVKIRYEAAQYLGSMGPHGKEAIPSLRSAYDSEKDKSTKYIMSIAIMHIESHP